MKGGKTYIVPNNTQINKNQMPQQQSPLQQMPLSRIPSQIPLQI